MDLLRLITCFSFLIISLGSYALPTSTTENLGIAFVHGTNDHRKDADGGYWKHEFTDTITELLPPERQLIIACDYSHTLWHPDAAGCTVNQLLKFIYDKDISQLVVYTHSHGANVIRWILSNPTYDPRYLFISKKIKQVVAIAPSSGGTVLADEVFEGNIFESTLGWLLGYHNDSVKQQRIGDMALLNEELLFGTPGRPSLPVPFRSVVGTDVSAVPFTDASTCNGYTLNAGLKITQAYLESCSDGFLGCLSQSLAGHVWFFDWEKTTNQYPLSHNQSRYACFSLEYILRDDLILNKEKL